MAIFFVLLSGAFVALSNLMMRKSIDQGGTTKGFLVFMMMTACLSAVLLEPVRSGNYAFSFSVFVLGTVAGIVLVSMLFFLGKALEKGPPGFTFSLLSSSTVMPAILMAAFFGADFGFPYTFWHGLGSLLVVAGIFWAGRGTSGMQDRNQWILLCAAMFILHVVLLGLFQWRSLLLNFPHPEQITTLFPASEIQSVWFLPIMFFVAGLIQLVIFSVSEKRRLRSKEALFGILGGAINGTGTFFLVCATGAASPLENAIVFPLYSVAIIALSNLWGQKLYQERVNWKACQLCMFGIMIGMVDWKGLAQMLNLF
jgi:hypothetical protein